MHTRKSHSLGAMHLAHRAICIILFRQHSQLRNSVCPLLYRGAIPPLGNELGSLPDLKDIQDLQDYAKFIQCIRLAGLLHDIGHAPLSHLFEDAYKPTESTKSAEFSHEAMSTKIICELLSPNPIPADMAKFVASIISGKELDPRLTFVHELISGPWDCDKLDYVMRDAYHSGTPEYGIIDSTRVQEGLVVSKNSLCILEDHIPSALDFLTASFAMYTAVYYHRTSRMFSIIMQEALSPLQSTLGRIANSPVELTKSDDYSFIYSILNQKADELKLQEEDYINVTKLLRAYLDRNKLYQELITERLDLDVFAIAQAEKNLPGTFRNTLEKLAEKIESEYKSYGIIVDTRPRIRSIGIRLNDIASWLTDQRVFSTTKGRRIEIKETHYSNVANLNRLNIPVVVFAPRDKAIDPETRKNIQMFLQAELYERIPPFTS